MGTPHYLSQPYLQSIPFFVGDVAHTVSDAELLALFQKHYPSTFEAHIVTDPATGTSKGYGFVRFAEESERDRAIQEMTGISLNGRPLRVSVAAKRQQGAGTAQERGAFSHGVTTVRSRPSCSPPVGSWLRNCSRPPQICLASASRLHSAAACPVARLWPLWFAATSKWRHATCRATSMSQTQHCSLAAWHPPLQRQTSPTSSTHLACSRTCAYLPAEAAALCSSCRARKRSARYTARRGICCTARRWRLSWGRNAAKHARPHAAGASVAAEGTLNRPWPQARPTCSTTRLPRRHRRRCRKCSSIAEVRQPGKAMRQARISPARTPEPMDLWHGMYGEAAATSGEGVGHGGYTGHPDASKTASRFGFEDPTTCDFAAANRRFASVAPPLLAPIAMAPARRVLHAGVMSYKAAV